MSDAPEKIWAEPSVDDKGQYWDVGHFDTDGEGVAYRRADLPPTPAQIMADPLVKALVEALKWYDDPSYKSDVARAALAAFTKGLNL